MRARLSLAMERPCSMLEKVFEPSSQLMSIFFKGSFNCFARVLMRPAIPGELYKDGSCILFKPPKSLKMATLVLTIAKYSDNMQP
nr:MAG TPA: hypothetical protein [Caudoviricetes sp.]